MKHTSFPKVKTEKRPKTYTTAPPMSGDQKTAEYFLRENASIPKPQVEGVLTAMQEYADQQSAALKEALAELIPIAERQVKQLMNDWREDEAAIDRAKKLLDKTE